jgi:hypothetical protein
MLMATTAAKYSNLKVRMPHLLHGLSYALIWQPWGGRIRSNGEAYQKLDLIRFRGGQVLQGWSIFGPA